MLHFGVKVLPGKYGLKLCRENYAVINDKVSLYCKREAEAKIEMGLLNHKRVDNFNGSIVNRYSDESCMNYSAEWCIMHQKNCLLNFDLNITFFKQLDNTQFSKEIKDFLSLYSKFKQITDLNELNNISGYYMMILDDYSQVYIGTSSNIMKRVRQHWSKSKYFDRLLFPQDGVETSILSIDSFRALDTTRIYALTTDDIYVYEDEYISFFSSEYVSNRISGGNIASKNINQLIVMLKSRNLKSK